jgi:hypothetical protein
LRVFYIGSQPQRNRNPQFAKDQNSASKGRIFCPHGHRVTVGNDAKEKALQKFLRRLFTWDGTLSAKRSACDLIFLFLRFNGEFLVLARRSSSSRARISTLHPTPLQGRRVKRGSVESGEKGRMPINQSRRKMIPLNAMRSLQTWSVYVLLTHAKWLQ